MSAFEAGEVFGRIMAIIAPLAIGYFVAKRLTARRDGYDPVRWPIVVGAVVSLLMLAGTCAPKPIPAQPVGEGR